MEKVLITGGAGHIGSELAERLTADNRYHVVILDDLSTGSRANLPSDEKKNWEFVPGDVNNYDQMKSVMNRFGFHHVFHYAAVVGVKRTLMNPVKVLKDIEGIKNILDLSRSTGVKRVFFSSSSEIYGEPVEFPQNESTTPLNSRLTYAVVKNVGECYLKAYCQEYGLSFTIFRFFNTYGPRQSTDFVMSRFMRAALRNEDIVVFGDGKQTRTFCYIDDNTETAYRILEEGHFENDIVNIGNDLEIPIRELAETIVEILGSSSKIVHVDPLKEGDMTRRLPDIGKMRAILKRPLTPLREGIEKMLQSQRLLISK